MPQIKELITHILFHVDAEASDSDSSQVSGVQQRAGLVRSSLLPLKNDNRNLSLPDVLLEIGSKIPDNTSKASLLRALDNITESPQQRIQEWVGKNRESLNG